MPTERRAGRVIWKHCVHHISAGPPQCVPCQGAGHAHRQATQGEKARSRKANVLRHVQIAPHVLGSPHIRLLMSLRALQPKPSCRGWSRHSNHSQRGALVSKSDTFLDKMCRWFINSFTCGVPAERGAGRAIRKHCAHHISAGPPQYAPCQGAGHAHRQATEGKQRSQGKCGL